MQWNLGWKPFNLLDDARISNDRFTMHHDRDDTPRRQDTRQRLTELAEKCDAGGEHFFAARMRKVSGELASDKSTQGGFSWFPFTPLKDNKVWRRMLSIVVGIAFVLWAVASIFIGHITVTHANLRYYVDEQPFGFWLVISFIFFLGAGCIYRGFRGRK